MSEERISPTGHIALPVLQHPLYRTDYAIQRGVERKLLFRTWGGIGDQICAEPTLRHAIKKFKDCEISLASECPDLFRHLKFKKVFDLNEVTPNYNNYFVFDTITSPDESNLVWCFISHMLTNCVDFPSMCALRLQLPVEEKVIWLSPEAPPFKEAEELYNMTRKGPVIHPGKHWQSKTFPKKFWDEVIEHLVDRGLTPILIGANADDNRGTVDVTTEGCVDLRNKLSINDSCWLLGHATVLLTNDSAPLHMAAGSGGAWIGYIATCKHPDMITHWRRNQNDEPEWNWREVNHGKGGAWDILDYCPNKKHSVEAEFVPPEILETWLPDPMDFASWAEDRHKEEIAEEVKQRMGLDVSNPNN